jgi:hypothetical protein
MFAASVVDRLCLLRGDTLEITHSWRVPADQRGWHGAWPRGPLALVSGTDRVTLLEADGTVRWATAHTPWSGRRKSGCAWFDSDGRAFAVVPDPHSGGCLLVHLDRSSGRVLAQRRVSGEPAGITPVPQGDWMGLSEGEGQDAARTWWVRLDEAGQLQLRDAGWNDTILADSDPSGTRALTTPHSGYGPLVVRSFPELRALRTIAAPADTSWAETACFAGERIIARLLGEHERAVAVEPNGALVTLEVGDGFLVGAADGTWLIGGRDVIERWTLAED